MPNVHPLLVHFPIALIFAVVACDFIGLVFKKRSFIAAGSILTVFALVAAVFTVISGLLAEDIAWKPPAVGELIDTHELLGFIFLGIVVVLAIFRFAVKQKLYSRLGWAALAIGIVAAGVVSAGGYIGGEMVYRYGTGIEAAKQETARADSLAQQLNQYRGIEKAQPERQNPKAQ